MGTGYRVVVSVDNTSESVGRKAIAALIQATLDAVDAKMSTYKEDSEVSRFNRFLSVDPFPVSKEVAHVVSKSLEISVATGGAFDVTIGPLINAWGFGVQDSAVTPSSSQLSLLAERTGYGKLLVDLESNTLFKSHPDLEINLSAIAKGYGVDRVAEELLARGVAMALIEVGGEVRALGRPTPERRWRVAVERPDGSGETQRTIELEDQSLATSGDYRNFRQLEDGNTVSHLLDPRLREPIQHRGASVSIVASDCTTADAWGTALFVLGPAQQSGAMLPSGLWALFVTHNEEGFGEVEFGEL